MTQAAPLGRRGGRPEEPPGRARGPGKHAGRQTLPRKGVLVATKAKWQSLEGCDQEGTKCLSTLRHRQTGVHISRLLQAVRGTTREGPEERGMSVRFRVKELGPGCRAGLGGGEPVPGRPCGHQEGTGPCWSGSVFQEPAGFLSPVPDHNHWPGGGGLVGSPSTSRSPERQASLCHVGVLKPDSGKKPETSHNAALSGVSGPGTWGWEQRDTEGGSLCEDFAMSPPATVSPQSSTAWNGDILEEGRGKEGGGSSRRGSQW